jgi:leucyl-tRNA synthetase
MATTGRERTVAAPSGTRTRRPKERTAVATSRFADSRCAGDLVARDAEEEVVVEAEMWDAAVGRFVEGNGVRKRVYVANRLLNLVVS